MIRSTIHTDPSRNRSFYRKWCSNQANFKTPGQCVLVWTGNSLQTGLFEDDYVTIIIWFPWPSFPQTQIQMASKRCVFKLPRRIALWTGSQRIFFYFNLRNNFRKHCSLNVCKHPTFILLLTCAHTECGLMLYTDCNQGGGKSFAHGWSRPWCHQALTGRRYEKRHPWLASQVRV